jgi:hypothetical protein
VEIGRDTISRITSAVLDDVQVWRSRPLDRVYAIVYLDAMTVKIREDRSKNPPCRRRGRRVSPTSSALPDRDAAWPTR